MGPMRMIMALGHRSISLGLHGHHRADGFGPCGLMRAEIKFFGISSNVVVHSGESDRLDRILLDDIGSVDDDMAYVKRQHVSLVHFNDVYNIESRVAEPVGGAARFAHVVRHFREKNNSLVLFSGDCLNPSLLSAFTKGQQMVPTFNALGVHAACLGNHDLDFGIDVLQERMADFQFPWILTNVFDIETEKPLAGAHHSLVVTWEGIRIGILGLVERDWLLTIPSMDAEKDIIYEDFIEEGRKTARKLLKEDSADIVIALTHMRDPNDLLLASSVPEISLVLGGHDHDYFVQVTEPYGTPVIKSGTDFRELSHINVEILLNQQIIGRTVHETIGCQQPAKHNDSRNVKSKGFASCGKDKRSDSQSASLQFRRGDGSCQNISIGWERIVIDTSIPEDMEMSAIVEQYKSLADSQMDTPLGRTFLDLDARFDSVRSRESNIGNLLADVMRLGLNADVAFLNGGTIRSDMVHTAGRLTMRDFLSALPFLDELVVIEATGLDIIAALENGVSSWPTREGRFLQVSGLRFKFDPRKPPGARIVKGSVYIGSSPLEPSTKYRVATKHYIKSGKDGFNVLKDTEVVVDGETAPRLATLVQYLLTRIEELNVASGANSEDTNENRPSSNSIEIEEKKCDADPMSCPCDLRPVQQSPSQPQPCAHGLDALYFYNAVTEQYGIAPQVEGRIINVTQPI